MKQLWEEEIMKSSSRNCYEISFWCRMVSVLSFFHYFLFLKHRSQHITPQFIVVLVLSVSLFIAHHAQRPHFSLISPPHFMLCCCRSFLPISHTKHTSSQATYAERRMELKRKKFSSCWCHWRSVLCYEPAAVEKKKNTRKKRKKSCVCYSLLPRLPLLPLIYIECVIRYSMTRSRWSNKSLHRARVIGKKKVNISSANWSLDCSRYRISEVT